MNLEYSLASAEEIVINLLKNTLSKKGSKGARKLIDDIMNERALNVADDVKQELQKYSTDTLRLIVEKEILLSLENNSLANRKSYWDVLKSRAPRIKTGIMAHYYDSYINTLKQEKPATYQARTITELKETYDKAINDSFHVINETGEAILDIVSSVNVDTNNNTINFNNGEGNLELDGKTTVRDGKFVNKDELITALDRVENLPNGSELITNNPNVSVSDIKNIANSLSGNLNITSNENEQTVTLGQAGIKEVGNISYNDTPTLPDGTYVSIEELNIAINNFINKPLEERKPAKILRIKQEVRKQVAMVAMSFTILTAALPVLKNKIQNTVIPTITQEIENGNLSTENIMSTIDEQVSNIAAGAQNVQKAVGGVVEKAGAVANDAMDTLAQVPEIFQSQVIADNPVATEDVAPVNEVVPEATDSVNNIEETVPETNVEENIVSEEPVEKVTEEVAEVVEETPVEETTEEVVEEAAPVEEIEENRLATKDDFSFKYPESNEIAAAARNMGFTDEEILIAVAIAREETGNYTSPAYLEKNNFGGMTVSDHVRMSFDSREEGLNRFLLMLRNGYFDKGLTTIDAIAPVYDPESTTWPNEVRGCMEKDGINPPQESETTIDEPVEEVTQEVTEVNEEAPVEETIEEVTEPIAEETSNEVEEITQEKHDVIKANSIEAVVEEPITEEVTESIVNEPVVEEVPVVEQPVIVEEPINNEVDLVKQEQIVVGQNIAATQNTSEAAAALLGITPDQLDVVKATIRHEAGNNPAEMANVASCVRNRMVSRATNPYAIITAAGQFESYLKGYYRKYTGGNYYQGDPETAAQVNAMLDGILTGTSPTTHGYENFRSASSPIGVQFTDGGNKYR